MGGRRRSLRFWLLSGTLLAVLFAGIGLGALHLVLQAQMDRYAERFQLLSSLRKQALEDYFETVSAELTFWSLNRELLAKHAELLKQWSRYREAGDTPAARLEYEFSIGAVQAELHVLASMFVAVRGYYDFFLISPEGDVFYTVEKEADFGTNLNTGPWRDSGLAEVFRRALGAGQQGRVVFSDFESYGPSAGAPAMFMATRLQDRNGRVLGALALQVPTEGIDAIMRFTAGMGQSGETYLVGEDMLMRSDSRFADTSTILQVEVDTDSVKRALDGQRGAMFTADYRGVTVLSAFDSTDIDNFRWAVMAEIDKDEVVQMAAGKRPVIAGLMLFLYSLAMWSIWYIRPGDWSGGEALAGLDTEADYGDAGGA